MLLIKLGNGLFKTSINSVLEIIGKPTWPLKNSTFCKFTCVKEHKIGKFAQIAQMTLLNTVIV